MNNYLDKIKGLGKEKSSSSNSIPDLGEVYLIDENEPSKIIKIFDKEPKTDEINMPNDLVDLIIGNKKPGNKMSSLVNMPVASINILFKTVLLAKSSQFNAKALPKQLELFEEEYKREMNSKVYFKVDIKDISSNKSKDGKIKGRVDKVKEAVDFLQSNLYVWAKGKDSKGNIVNYKLTYIEKPSFTRGILTFEMNIFWVEQLVNLNLYNKVLKDLPILLGNSRYAMFSLYLERFDDNKWFKWNYENINKLFDLNYSTALSMSKGFMRDVKQKLDLNSLKSFAYKVKGNDILILPYRMNSLVGNDIVKLNEETVLKNENRNYVNFIARKHKLSDEKRKNLLTVITNSKTDKEIVKSAYELFKKDCKKKKCSILDITEDNFLHVINEFIYQEYKRSEKFKDFPNGYPRI
ncbi:hypothetical protein CMT75_18745 [Elizabethkingia anophelis]|uniref:hypothetical protein n=1 Tax=Elizabethkingia sp. M8 TaxID=2796140 RepID=UPI0019078F1C|nr:hypothetical protein [Elizabethkingia sp. M8]MDV3950557.1 hypothetical protein [Elizabethkingia anophelis]QQM26556.1 hypothetical protein JCR23_17190 [Elizabethkingia sp. M8]